MEHGEPVQTDAKIPKEPKPKLEFGQAKDQFLSQFAKLFGPAGVDGRVQVVFKRGCIISRACREDKAQPQAQGLGTDGGREERSRRPVRLGLPLQDRQCQKTNRCAQRTGEGLYSIAAQCLPTQLFQEEGGREEQEDRQTVSEKPEKQKIIEAEGAG